MPPPISISYEKLTGYKIQVAIMPMRGPSYPPPMRATLCFILFLLGAATAQGDDTGQYLGEYSCPNGHVNWYTECFGETPCKTYVYLRSACEPEYILPNITLSPPNDRCPSAESCCCNSAAFELYMLCLNCQNTTFTSNDRRARSDYDGIDGDYQAYKDYLGICSLPPPLFPDNANANITIPHNADFLFISLSPNEKWSYSETVAKFDNETQENQTLCRSTSTVSASGASTSFPMTMTQTSTTILNATVSHSITTSSTTGSPFATGAKSNSDGNLTSSPPTGAIAGGAIGAAVVVVVVGLLLRRRRARSRRGVTRATQEPHQSYEFYIDGPPGTAPSTPNALSAGVVTSDAGATQSSKNSTPSIIYPQQIQSPETHAPPYDDLRSPVPESDPPNPALQYAVPSRFDSDLRHTDAGVLIPLSRSSSGRLPPAYLSWEDNVDLGSAPPLPQQGSASLPGAPIVDQNATAFRLEGKAE